MSRYDALTEALRDRSDELIELNFEEISSLVGGLPPSATKHAAWWSNGPSAHQGRYWTSAGRRAKPDLIGGFVQFTLAEGEPVGRPRKNKKKSVPTAAPSVAESEEVVTLRPATLVPTDEHVRTAVYFEWQSAGEVRLRDGKLDMPHLPARSGVYRLTIDHGDGGATSFVAETKNLFRSMANIRAGITADLAAPHLTDALVRAINKGGSVRVDVVTAGLCSGESLNFENARDRRLVESVAVIELLRSGAKLEEKDVKSMATSPSTERG